MTHELWRQKHTLRLTEKVYDIVQFGSSTLSTGEPHDIDIAVIFTALPVKDQLIQAQEIKRQLEPLSDLPIHIKPFDLEAFFSEGNFAREGILFYGQSITMGTPFAFRFGLAPHAQISYNLDKMAKKDKIRLHYALQGKGGKYGLLKKHNGQLIRPGLVEVPPEHEQLFATVVQSFTTDCRVRKVFISQQAG